MFQHPTRHVACNRHDRSVRSTRFCHLGDGLMAEIVKSKALEGLGCTFSGFLYLGSGLLSEHCRLVASTFTGLL